MTVGYIEEENTWRTLHRDEENRTVKTFDNYVATNYCYNAENKRVKKVFYRITLMYLNCRQSPSIHVHWT
ncbi:MAG: hypothetical protein ACOCWZ_12380 [Spirochaetota bacterium]